MANLKTHCEDCQRELGEEFREVHAWLDEIFKYLGNTHREFRHTKEGVEKVRRMWGDRAARAAEIHIERDNKVWNDV